MANLSGMPMGTAKKATPVVPLVCLLTVVILLSSVTLVIKYVFQYSGIQPMGLAWIRVMVGFIFLFAITLLWDWRGLLSLAVTDVFRLVVVGFFGVFSYAIAACGLMHTSVIHYALIYSLLPSCTATLSVLSGKEQVGPVKLVGIALSLIGCIIALSDSARSVEASFGLGDMFVLLLTIMMSGHIVLSSSIVKRFGVMVSNTVMFGSSSLLLFLGSLQWVEPQHEELSPLMTAAVLYVGLATAAVFLLRYRSLQSLPPATVGTYHNLIPVLTILLAYLFLGEPLGIQTIVGGATVVAGAELVRKAHLPQLAALLLWAKPSLRSAVSSKPSN